MATLWRAHLLPTWRRDQYSGLHIGFHGVCTSTFTVPTCPLGADHTHLFSLATTPTPPTLPPPITHYTTTHFTWDCDHIYQNNVYLGLLHMDPSAPLETLTSHLTNLLHSSALSCFPHTSHSTAQGQGRDDAPE